MSGANRKQATADARRWIEEVGCWREWWEVRQTVFGDNGRLEEWAADEGLVEQIRRHW